MLSEYLTSTIICVFQGAALVLLVTITSTSTGSTQHRHPEGSVAALRASAGRCERFVPGACGACAGRRLDVAGAGGVDGWS